MDYVLVIKKGNSHKIGLKRYSKEQAFQRKDELRKSGIIVEVMGESEAFGV